MQYVVPSHIPQPLIHHIRVTAYLPGHERYLAVKRAQRELNITLRQAKALVARIADFTWSDPLPSHRLR
tara:strand:+ start:205 stop:411 length:207 start_codon:yes stop_codon:yes gene_type:complete